MSLYKSASGREVSAHSYSGGSEFKFCRRKYKLHRILGWQEKAKKAALEIGKCLESAIQYFHQNECQPDGCVDEWKRLWLKFEGIEMDYSDQEGSWAEVYTLGTEWAKLYEVLLPSLPIKNPKFQLEYRKEVFLGSGLEFLAYIDLLSTADDGTRTVIDIKSAKMGLDLSPNMLCLDPQLRRYAWVTGITNVGFLWFVKTKPNSFKKGDSVTLLEKVSNFLPGEIFSVVKYEETETEKRVLLGKPDAVQLMESKLAEISGKGATAAKEAIIESFLASERILWTTRSAVTKAKLQFIKAVIPEGDLTEIGDAIGHEMVSIKDSYEKNFWPLDGGVRFPANQCVWCSYRGICTSNTGLRDELLVQIELAEPEKDWLSDLEEN